MFGGNCASTQTAANSITDVKVAYDGQAAGTPPTKGDITEQDTLDTWDASGKPANHENPHQHRYEEPPTGGTRKRGGAEPLEYP